ncbi:ATP-binding protein, partial [Patescibacteria group bacterium]
MINFDWPVIGQEKIKKFLAKSMANDKLSHAYLFTGQQHLGKKLLADNFIASVLCHDYHLQNKLKIKELPCGECAFCQQLSKKIHPDVYFLDKEEDKKNITVEQVREMQKLLHMGSFLNSYKIALISQAEDLSESAQNALLKILEEPRPKTILLVLAKDVNYLLPTISSRCQLIKFTAVEQEKIFKHLVSLGASREQARLYAALANGKVGLAINFYQNPDLFKDYLAKTEKVLQLFSTNLADRFMLLEKDLAGFTSNNAKIDYWQQELDSWQLVLRDILIMQNSLEYLITNLY